MPCTHEGSLAERGYTPPAHKTDGEEDPSTVDFLTRHKAYFYSILAGILFLVAVFCIYALWRGPHRSFFPQSCARRKRTLDTIEEEGQLHQVKAESRRGLWGSDTPAGSGKKIVYLTDLRRQTLANQLATRQSRDETGGSSKEMRVDVGRQGKTKGRTLRKSRLSREVKSIIGKGPNFDPSFQLRYSSRQTLSSFGQYPSTSSQRSGSGESGRLSEPVQLPMTRERLKRLSMIPEHGNVADGNNSERARALVATQPLFTHDASAQPPTTMSSSIDDYAAQVSPNRHFLADSASAIAPSRRTWGPSPLGGGPPPVPYPYTGSPISAGYPSQPWETLVPTNPTPTASPIYPVLRPLYHPSPPATEHLKPSQSSPEYSTQTSSLGSDAGERPQVPRIRFSLPNPVHSPTPVSHAH